MKNGGNLQAKYFIFKNCSLKVQEPANFACELRCREPDEADGHGSAQYAGASVCRCVLETCSHVVVQEQALEDISDTLGRLHDIGSAIGNEVDIQTVGEELGNEG